MTIGNLPSRPFRSDSTQRASRKPQGGSANGAVSTSTGRHKCTPRVLKPVPRGQSFCNPLRLRAKLPVATACGSRWRSKTASWSCYLFGVRLQSG